MKRKRETLVNRLLIMERIVMENNSYHTRISF